MSDTYETLLNIPRSHKLVIRSGRMEQRKGQDADIYECVELDSRGLPVARYEVRDSMSIYPPFRRSVTWRKLDE
jgi:hypothetical protein